MNVLFDHNVNRKLRQHLSDHDVRLTVEEGWDGLSNGELLTVAQDKFDVLVTCDANLYHQQKVAAYHIAVIVLRAVNNRYETMQPLMTDLATALAGVQPGTIHYLYADLSIERADRKRSKSPFAKRP